MKMYYIFIKFVITMNRNDQYIITYIIQLILLLDFADNIILIQYLRHYISIQYIPKTRKHVNNL